MVEDPRKPPHDRVSDLLDDWRDAERDADKEQPDSAALKMARKRADAARDNFHEAEDVEREVMGNHRPRNCRPSEEEDVASEAEVPRRGDPERIYQAQRAGIFRRLADVERVNELDAEHWLSRWEREADANGPAVGSQGYRDAGWRWTAENHRKH